MDWLVPHTYAYKRDNVALTLSSFFRVQFAQQIGNSLRLRCCFCIYNKL